VGRVVAHDAADRRTHKKGVHTDWSEAATASRGGVPRRHTGRKGKRKTMLRGPWSAPTKCNFKKQRTAADDGATGRARTANERSAPTKKKAKKPINESVRK